MRVNQSDANDSPPCDSFIVFIAPCAALLAPTTQDVSKFFESDVPIAKSVHNSPFKPYILDARKNYARKCLALIISFVTSAILPCLHEMSMLGNWQVTCC